MAKPNIIQVEPKATNLYAAEQKLPRVDGLTSPSGGVGTIQQPKPSTNQYYAGGEVGYSGNPSMPVQQPAEESKNNIYDLYGDTRLPQQDPNAVYMDEIQKAMSEKNYKALLQSDIAAYNLKQNSQKYLDQMLAGQGLAGQWYGTSAHIGIENSAQNLYAQNLENYAESERQALVEAQERKDAADLENDKQLYFYLTNSDGSDDSIAQYMANYGYTLKDGKWVDANGNEASGYVLSAIQYAKDNAVENEGIRGAYYGSLEALMGATYIDKDGGVSNFNDNFSKESEYIYTKAINGQYDDGTVIKVTNGRGETVFLRFDYGKGFVQVEAKDWAAAEAENKARYIKWDGGKVVENEAADQNDKEQEDRKLQAQINLEWTKKNPNGGTKTIIKYNGKTYVYKNGKWVESSNN